MNSKRGQGLSTNAIVLIILAVVVLVILIIGFTMGWNKFAPWLSSNNVDNIVNSCSIACSTDNTYEFCDLERTLKADDLPGEVNEMKATCEFFSTDADYSKYGISACSSINCE